MSTYVGSPIDLREYPQGREEYRYDDSQQIHREPPCTGMIYFLIRHLPLRLQ